MPLALAAPVLLALAAAPALAATSTASTSSVAAPAPCEAAVDDGYARGFDHLAGGRAAAAAVAFEATLAACPSHPHAAELLRLAREVEARAGGAPPALAVPGRGGEAPSLLARGELVTLQTFHGLAQGLLVCDVARCDGAREVVVSAFVGAAAFGGLSFWLSADVRPGEASAVDSGTAWGLWTGLALGAALDDAGVGWAIGGLLGGTGVGVLAAALLEPTAGEVALANSGGLWAGVAMFWALQLVEVEPDRERIFGAGLAATTAGLVGGMALSRVVDVSRGRMALVDAGGVVGALLGLGAALLIDEDASAPLRSGLALGGTGLGLAAGWWFTRGLDVPDPPAVTFAPVGPGDGAGFTAGARF